MCGGDGCHLHHIFGASNRNKSTKYGYVVYLCVEHHTGRSGVHQNRLADLRLKEMAQKHFELVHGDREDFIKVFGRSYL